MGGMLATMRWKKRSLPLNVSALKRSTSSPSSSTVVWREVLCSPSSAAGSRPVRVDADICCSLDDEEVDVWAAVIVGSEVGVACVVPLVVCLCLSTGDVASGVALSDCLRGVDEERPDSSLSSILLIRCVAALRAEVVRDKLGSSVADATLCVVVFDAELLCHVLDGESDPTTSTKVLCGPANEPSAIITDNAGGGADVVWRSCRNVPTLTCGC